MTWVNGHVSVRHAREPWDAGAPERVLVHRALGYLKGSDPSLGGRQPVWREQYDSAKRSAGYDAAVEIVRRTVRQATYELILQNVLTADHDRLKIVFLHPAFEEGVWQGDPTKGVTNALPFAYAELLAKRLGGQVDHQIEQRARVGRTELNRWQRFLWQPAFRGDVEPGCHYIIADDVVTLGATFASLRSHIVRGGGTVCAVTALAHATGAHQQLPVASPTVDSIGAMYGNGVFGLWKEALGHGIQALTEGEGLFLCEWGRAREREGFGRGDPLLQRLRARLDQAASRGG